ncbi:hypothetical protein J2X31_001417 [Flavobacterium arsenatis]|uniref:DUF4421 domain-containing protein n=1 Tax=Flavobacterium arsenatis TaxID=1484332 RepID=A0ABU1TND8_9FLAO|nr:hypothetical protein [Flavobacterium arsenatis]MDR6967406.1 hypothetical protein [Flavobacterium arsenatis]
MKLKFLLLTGFLCHFANGQENQTIKENATKAVTNRFPSTRLFDLQYQHYLPTDFDSELFDAPFEKGEIQNHYRFSASANLPIIMKPKWNITTSLRYRYEAFDLNNVENRLDNSIPTYDEKLDYHYLSGALSFTYFSRLFKKPFLYNASIIVDGTEKDAERIKGFFGATIILKKTERTTIGVGLIVLVDPTSPVPASPTFIWEHQFKDSQWKLDFILPQRFMFKRNVFKDGRLSLGTELNTNGFYTYINQPGFAKVYDYRVIELNSGLTYEHSFSNSLIASFRTGIANVFNSRISERGKNTNDYIFSSQQDGTGYFSLGFSFNPTIQKKKK